MTSTILRKPTSQKIHLANSSVPPDEEKGVSPDFNQLLMMTLLDMVRGKEKRPISFPEMRIMGLFGRIDMESAQQAIYSLYVLRENGETCEPNDPEDEESGYTCKCDPMKLIIDSEGGELLHMFAIYDVMSSLEQRMDIETVAAGMCASAATLLLAAGTKGLRYVGKNTRLLMHGIHSVNIGKIASLENEMKETKRLSHMFIKAMVKHTNLSYKEVKKIFMEEVDHYVEPKEAIKMGLADHIL